MNLTQNIITIGLCALATMLTRFLPFICFSSDKKTPPFIQYLGRALPGAVFALLIVYCLKNVDFMNSATHGAEEIISIGVVVGVHLYKGQMLLSIAVGTICYMALVQTGILL